MRPNIDIRKPLKIMIVTWIADISMGIHYKYQTLIQGPGQDHN